MSAPSFLVGLAWLAATLVPLIAASGLALARTRPDLRGAEAVVAFGVLMTAGLMWAHVVPLALGVLYRPTVVLAALVALAATALVVRRGEVPPARVPARAAPPSGAASILLAALGIAIVSATALVFLRRDGPVPLMSIDGLNIHLPAVASDIRHHTLWRIDQFVPGYANGNYPQNGDVVLLSAVLPWRDAFLARFSLAPFYAFTGLATYVLARELSAPAATAALTGALVTAIPTVSQSSLQLGMPDVVMYATFAAGLAFLLRHRRSGLRGDLVLAGLGLGIAFGTKWYALPSVAAVLAVWTVWWLRERIGVRAVMRNVGLLAGLVAAAGGIWMVRNLVESANPFFPQPLRPFFDAPPDPLRDATGSTLAHYLGTPHVWTAYLWPQFKYELGEPAFLLWAGTLVVLAVAAAGLRRASLRVPREVAACLVLTLLLVVVYVTSPYSALGPRGAPVAAYANMRYAVPSLLVAAGLLAWAVGRARGPARVGLEALLVLAAVGGLQRDYDVSGKRVAAVALVGLILWAAWRARPERLRGAGAARVAGALGVIALVAVMADQRHRFADTYAGSDETLTALVQRLPAHGRIGLAGIVVPDGPPPGFPAFGPHMENDVEYVGPVIRHRLETYPQQRPFVAALRRGRFDLLVVGRGIPPQRHVPEQSWAGAAGFHEVAHSRRLVLMAPGHG